MAFTDRLVRLEKHLEWRLWKGYVGAGCVVCSNDAGELEWMLERPSSGTDYYDAGAFPSLKPDIDIFGIPRRSRKQRGWYQITPPIHSHVHHSSLISIDESVPLRTAAELPEELFERVLAQFTSPPHSVEYSAESRLLDFTKHQLGNCALVCRFWAQHCQRKIFYRIAIRTREDILSLIALLKDPNSRVSQYVNQLSIRASMASPPWLHLVPSLYQHLNNMIDDVSITLAGPLPHENTLVRSVHLTLPRAPPAFLAGIYDIELKNIHFRRLEDLATLMWEARHLGWLQCEQLTWDTKATSALQLQRRVATKRHAHAVKAQFVGCSQNWASVWLANTHMLRDDCLLVMQDYERLGLLARVFEDGTKASIIGCYPFDMSQEMDTTIVSFSMAGPFDSPWENGRVISLHIRISDPLPTSLPEGDSAQTLHISELSLYFDADQPEAYRGINWAVFDEVASTIPFLKSVTMYFKNDTHMNRFTEERLGEQLKQLSGANKLRLDPKWP